MLTLANPAGLWALLGIPAVLAIHFLQRQAVVLPISTLFLLDKTQRESASGRKIDRLMNSVPLWMQLLAVLLLTWLLVEPRYQKPRSTQRVAIVLDSSASMAVFKDRLREQLATLLPNFKGPAADLEITLLESFPGRERLYSGSSLEEFNAAFDAWIPRDGLTDPARSLRLARSLAAREGIVLFATDTPRSDLPSNALLLAVGEEIENAGITGVRFERKEGALVWNALVRNYSKNRTSRDWRMEFPDGSATPPKTIELEPGALFSLQAALPEGADRARLVLSADRFTLDDVVPLVRPRPKTLTLHTTTSPEFAKLAERLIHSLEAVEPAAEPATADLSLVSYDPLDPVLPPGNAVVFVHDGTRGGAYLKGGIVAEKHPLIEGLNWQALLVRETIQLERRPADNVLLWQDTRPLIFLRQLPATDSSPAASQLCFNFDLRLSNAVSQPAFIVCLHRFVASLRESKIAGYSDNLETGQPVTLAAASGAEAAPVVISTLSPEGKPLATRELPAAAIVRFPAPLEPGFLRVSQGDSELLTAAVHFADTREADFSACATAGSPDTGGSQAIQRHTNEDHWWRAWLLLLLAALLVSWYFTKDRSSTSSSSPRITNHRSPGTSP